MKQLEIQERQLQKTLGDARAANLPTLNLSANYNFTAMEDNSQVQPVYVESLFVCHAEPQHPIFAGGKRRADIKQAKLNLSNPCSCSARIPSVPPAPMMRMQATCRQT